MRDIREDLRERLAAIQAASNAAIEEHENRALALQADYRQKADALERERQAVLQMLKFEEARARPTEPGTARPPALPLAEFIITKIHANGMMTKEEIRAEVDQAGYLEGEATGRTFHLTLMNISGTGGRICRMSDGRYAVPGKVPQETLFGSAKGETPHALM
jgi:hypothetical protein